MNCVLFVHVHVRMHVYVRHNFRAGSVHNGKDSPGMKILAGCLMIFMNIDLIRPLNPSHFIVLYLNSNRVAHP